MHRKEILAVLGRVGFATKAFVYAGVGWLACRSALSASQNESPQGVFLLLDNQRGVAGEIWLVATLMGLLCYVAWRFWEGLSGQGSTPRLSPASNFFKYRLSPLVSGVVYLAYGCYVGFLLIEPLLHGGTPDAPGAGSCFPWCWRDSAAGQAALALLALAFAIGAATQAMPALSASFEQEVDAAKLARVGAPGRWLFLVSGRIGFLARAALFALVAVYFVRILAGDDVNENPQQSTVARALNALRAGVAGKMLLFTVGVGLVVYGAFALANVIVRRFPTTR